MNKNTRHTIDIEEWFDIPANRWNVKITLQEYRLGKQYGGAVVWQFRAKRAMGHNQWMRRVARYVNTEALSLLTFELDKPFGRGGVSNYHKER